MQVVGIPLLKKELASITIPDISGKASIKVGHIRYNLKKYVIVVLSFILYCCFISLAFSLVASMINVVYIYTKAFYRQMK